MQELTAKQFVNRVRKIREECMILKQRIKSLERKLK